MRNSRFGRHLPKVVSLCVLAAMSLPAHSMSLETKNGLNFGMYATVAPTVSQNSSKFTYVYGDPSIYGRRGTIERVLADQDRQDSDRRARMPNSATAGLQLYANQALTKTWALSAGTLMVYYPEGTAFWANPWGISLAAKNYGKVTVGDLWTRLDVRQTEVDDILSYEGTNVRVDVSAIPDVTISAYHMLTASKDVRDPSDDGLHKSNGVAVTWENNFAPRHNLKTTIAYAKNQHHETPWFADKPISADAKFVSLGYQNQDWKFAVDVGRKSEKFNGFAFGDVTTDVLGVQVGYEITPRLTTQFNYSHRTTDNSNPVTFKDLTLKFRRGINETMIFDKVTQDRYGAKVNYELHSGVTLFGEAEQTKTRNFLTDGEFSRREFTQYNAGVRFTF